jgi:hypothetical protein
LSLIAGFELAVLLMPYLRHLRISADFNQGLEMLG